MKKIFLFAFILSFVVIFGCKNKLEVSDDVKFAYTGYFSDGTVFEFGESEISLGSGEVPIFMEKAIMNEKGKKNIEINVNPEEAYGPLYDKTKLQKVPRFIFEKIVGEFKVGDKKNIEDIEGVVKGFETMDESEYVLFDMNPRQTWDVLKYEIKILDK